MMSAGRSGAATALDEGLGVFGDGVLDFGFDGLDFHGGGEFFVLLPALTFLGAPAAAIGCEGLDIGDGEFADMALGEEVAGLGNGGDEAGGELAESVEVGGDLGA